MNDAQNICVNGQFNAKMEMQLLFLCLFLSKMFFFNSHLLIAGHL